MLKTSVNRVCYSTGVVFLVLNEHLVSLFTPRYLLGEKYLLPLQLLILSVSVGVVQVVYSEFV